MMGHTAYMELATMRQAELLREAEHERLVRSVTEGQPGLLARMRWMVQARLGGRLQHDAGVNAQRRLAS